LLGCSVCNVAHWLRIVCTSYRSQLHAGDLTLEDEIQMRRWCTEVIRLHQERSGACNAGLIVDPATDRAIGRGLDTRGGHPLAHAAMLALAEAAEDNLRRWPPASSAKRDQQSLADVPEPPCKTPRVDSDALVPRSSSYSEGNFLVPGAAGEVSSWLDGSNRSGSCQPYLCTGYDCYLFMEPCLMCAMALTHSRIRRVIYSQADSRSGALGSSVRLHGLRELNHRVSVYHAVMNGEG
jgi:tRNA-specific adenosine deaminase 3